MKKITLVLVSFLLFLCSSSWAGIPGFMKGRMGTLKGVMTVADKPLANAIVSFFNKAGGPPPVVGSARRVPDMVARTDGSGQFNAKLLPGSYYMGAMIRERGKGPGPPRPGEDYFFIRDGQGKLRSFEVKTKQLSDVGEVVGVAPREFKEFKNFITIKGTISDEAGKPLAGVLVTLKEKMSAPRPKFISERTGEDGAYELKVPPGKYFIMARESLRGGRPRAGSSIGTYGKSAPIGDASPVNAGGKSGGAPPGIGLQGGGGDAIAIEGKGGAVLSGINISMFSIPDPVETRRKFEEQARARDLEKEKK